MRKYLWPVLWFFVCLGFVFLTGCGPQQQRKNRNYWDDRALGLVGDTVEQIIRLYPPAQTRLVIAVEPDENDLFALGLVGKLRVSGYSVQEQPLLPKTAAGAGVALAASPAAGFTLSYLVDEFDGQVRVVVHIGQDVLSRIYSIDATSGNFIPAGWWSWRRGNEEEPIGEDYSDE